MDDAPADFRVRVAAERRERMRLRLLDAVLDLNQPGGGPPAVIDDVVRRADVSRGTFYKYFDSVDAAVVALGEALTASLITDFEAAFEGEPDPAVRAIGGVAIVIARSWHDPRWAGFTSRVDYVDFFARRHVADVMVRDCLTAARGAGQIAFTSTDVAVDLIVGATVEARRRLLRGIDSPAPYADELILRAFCGLGMDAAAAARASHQAWQRIRDCAASFAWWTPDRDWGGPANR